MIPEAIFSAQPKELHFKCDRKVLAGIVAYALPLTKELVSNSSDGQRHFDLI